MVDTKISKAIDNFKSILNISVRDIKHHSTPKIAIHIFSTIHKTLIETDNIMNKIYFSIKLRN